jgi:spermidine/putrescine-binding protein
MFAPARPLRVLAWFGMPDPLAISRAAETLGRGVEVVEIASNERLEELLDAEPGTWDLIFPSDYLVERLSARDRLLPLKPELLPLDRLAPWARECEFDPGNRLSVPFAYGTTGYLRRSDFPDAGTWQDLFAPPEGLKVGMLDEVREVVGAALISRGLDPNACDGASLEVAREVLEAQAPSVVRYDSDDFTGPVLSGDVSAHQAWSGPASKAVRESGGDLTYVVPAEGATLWITCAAVPADAPESEASLAMLSALMEPELSSLATLNGGYATPNDVARALLPPEIRDDETLFPDAETVAGSHPIHDVGSGGVAMERLFEQIKG